MRPFSLTTIAVAVFAVGAAIFPLSSNGLAGETPLSIYGLNKKEQRLFMAGVAEGITYLAIMQSVGREFCLPTNGRISGQFLWSLIAERISGPRRIETIAPLVTATLASRFPCPKVEAEAVVIQ